MVTLKRTSLFFGEGRKDKKFFDALIDLEKFKYHTKNWFVRSAAAHGCSAADVIKGCRSEMTGGEDLVLCFIDLDDLKNDYRDTWKRKKKELEEDAKASGIKIIWFVNNAEEEFKRVLGSRVEGLSKHKVNKVAQEHIDAFINSDLWKRILRPFQTYK